MMRVGREFALLGMAAKSTDGTPMKLRSIALPACALALSLAGVAWVVARGGSAQMVAWSIGPLVALGVVAAIGVGASWFCEAASRASLWWLGFAVLAGLVVNDVVPLALRIPGFDQPSDAALAKFLPLHPTGVDFQAGFYDPAKTMSSAASIYPPLTLWLGKPFTVLPYLTAYGLQVALLTALAIGCAYLSAKLAVDAVPALVAEPQRARTAMALAGVIGVWLLTSYGFAFEIERGNADLYAFFFALLALRMIVLDPDDVWLPAICIAFATNIKVYPAILLVVLFWQFRWRAVVPALVANAVLLFSAGVGNAVTFARNLAGTEALPYLWVGNHSAASFAALFARARIPAVGAIALLVPIALWLATLYVLRQPRPSIPRLIWAAAASVPLMSVVPAVSHDYKQVILVFPLALLAAATVSLAERKPIAFSAAFLAVAGELVLVARSVQVTAPAWVANKYWLVIVLQLAMIGLARLGIAEPAAALSDNAATPADGHLTAA
jgi:hypothetical protein